MYSETGRYGDPESENENEVTDDESEKDNFEQIDEVTETFNEISDRLDDETKDAIKAMLRAIETNCGEDPDDKWILKLDYLNKQVLAEFSKGNADVATTNLADLESQIERMK